VLIRVHSWFKYPPPPTPRKTPAQAHSTNQVPSQKNSCSFVSIRGSNPPTTNPSKNPDTTTLNEPNSNPKKIRVHSWFKYPPPSCHFPLRRL
jgi:hypothetical protein